MHFVDKQDGAAPILARLLLGDFDGLANLLDPGQDRRDRFKVGIRDFRQQPRQGGLAHARRAPEDHGVQCALLQCFTQGLAAGEQVLLADILVQVGRTQTGSQWLGYRGTSKQIHGQRLKPLPGLIPG